MKQEILIIKEVFMLPLLFLFWYCLSDKVHDCSYSHFCIYIFYFCDFVDSFKAYCFYVAVCRNRVLSQWLCACWGPRGLLEINCHYSWLDCIIVLCDVDFHSRIHFYATLKINFTTVKSAFSRMIRFSFCVLIKHLETDRRNSSSL